MPSPFPHHYRVGLVREGEHAVLNDGVKPTILGGPPPQFGGSPQHWGPEHLLLAAVALCFKATFDAIAAKGGVTVEAFDSEASGVLDRTQGGLELVSVTLLVNVTVAQGQEDLARRLLQTAKRHCIVANSLKRPVDVVLNVREEAALPAAIV